MGILEDKLSKLLLRMVLTKQLVLGLLSFRFMLLLLLGRFARVVNLDTKINVSIIII